MDTTRFDRISRLFAERRLSRRHAIAGGAAVAVSTLAGSRATAQEASPVASPVAESGEVEKTTFLFVQSFQSGTITPNTDDDLHTLTLENGLGQTLFFGDRPSREVGVTPTEEFLKGLGFSPDNPPNAALIVQTGDGDTDLAVLELFAPTYDESTRTATYQVKGLEAWEDSLDLGLQQSPDDLSGITPAFGAAHLLIDDCEDEQIACIGKSNGSKNFLAGTTGMCYTHGQCMPCIPYGHNPPDKCATFKHWAGVCNEWSYACPSKNCKPYWGNGISNWLFC